MPIALSLLLSAAPVLAGLAVELAERRLLREVEDIGKKATLEAGALTPREAIRLLGRAADRATPYTGLAEAASDGAITIGVELAEILWERLRQKHPGLPALDEDLIKAAAEGVQESYRERHPTLREARARQQAERAAA